MEILSLNTKEINQNGYHFNRLTKNKIGMIFTAPVDYVPDDCLACDGYVLKIADYKKLYSIIKTKFNDGTEANDEFRIPDYNITKLFLQAGSGAGTKIAAGLPNITGSFGIGDSSGTTTSGVFYTIASSRWSEGGGKAGSNPNVGFNASRSSSIYGKSTTVQPPSQIVHLCIKYK